MRTIKLMLTLAIFLGSGRATLGFIQTLDIRLLFALFIGCALTLPFLAYTLASAPEPDPVPTPHTTEDDFI